MNSGDLTECDRRGELVEKMLEQEQDINIKKKPGRRLLLPGVVRTIGKPLCRS
ncbi:hypothetical protein J2T14_003228 [Paenibacillus harenae]|nr:hypothetical protein [Paenibacillus harenae]